MWNTILTAVELDAYHAMTAKLDPRFAREEQAWYKGRTAAQLRSDAAGAWNCNNSTAYQLARSYAALAA